jgi:NADPH-dependent 2,4-dienoyl-CoA reductase/sulfur reductase-like enzyme
VRIPLQDTLTERVRFVQTEITGFDLPGRRLLTGAGPIGWTMLVLALGSRPNDFAIPGLAERALSLYSASDAEQVWAAAPPGSSWPRRCPRWPAARALRPAGPSRSSSRRARPSWPDPRRS